MLSSAQYVSPKPAALPPATQPALPGSGTAGGPSFAQFLNDQPEMLPPPAHTDPVPVAPDTAGEAKVAAAPAPATTTAPARRKEGNAASAKPATPPAGRAPDAATGTGKPASDTQACDDASATTDATADVDQEPETSGLNEFTQLIGLAVQTPQAVQAQAVASNLPGAPATTADSDAEPAAKSALAALGPAGTRGARAGRAVDEDANNPAPRASSADAVDASTTERRPAEAPARTADAPRARGIELAADKAAAARSASSDALQTATAAPDDALPRAAAPPDALTPSFAAVLAQALPTAAAAADTKPAPPTSQVHAALHSNAFGPELAASVSLLAVDGVQTAELQLNPADMGPVAVQIVVDGAQAQVSFHAVQAETRQALEQSLPDLAAALQGQGLTLSGGGVFQQSSRDTQGGDAEAGNTDGRSARTSARGGHVAGTSAAATAPARRVVGLLDTFA